MANCIVCLKQLKTGKFCCSHTCSNKAFPRRSRIRRFCLSCKVELNITTNKRIPVRCDECYRRITSPGRAIKRQLTLDEIKTISLREIQARYPSNKSKGLNRNATVRYYAGLLNADLVKRYPMCQMCGYHKHVEMAHIKPISTFDDESTIEEINGETNLLILCPTHHWEFDAGILSLSEIPSRV